MKRNNLFKVTAAAVIAAVTLMGCASAQNKASADTTASGESLAVEKTDASESASAESTDKTESGGDGKNVSIDVFAAASLKGAMDEIIAEYSKTHENVVFNLNTDSSGKLKSQIEEGFSCDIFFSAGKSQMEKLKEGGFVIDGTDIDLLHNKLCMVASKNSDTVVTGTDNLSEAKSLSIGETGVPAGQYARAMLSKLYPDYGFTKESTGKELSEKLGMEVIENSNVTKVLLSVVDGFGEIGFVYVTDTYGNDDVKIIAEIDKELTGEIIYPLARIKNDEASSDAAQAADEFYEYLKSDTAKEVFKKYLYE